MGTKSSSQVLSIASILIAALFSMSIAYQLTVHARRQLLSEEAEKTATQVVRQLERELGGIGKIFDPSQKARLDQALKDKNFAPNLFSYVVSDANNETIYASGNNKTGPEGQTIANPVRQKAPSGGRKIHVELSFGNKTVLPHYFSDVYVPIVENGAVYGSIRLYFDETTRLALYKRSFGFLTAGLLIIMALGSLLAGSMISRKIFQNQKAENQIRYLADYDPLTGLMNRTSFNAALDKAVANWSSKSDQQTYPVLMWLDLNEFKEINDSFGHTFGDKLLKYVAKQLREGVIKSDLVARIGGDEFAILCQSAKSKSELKTLVESLCTRLNTVVCIDDQFVQCGICIGIAPFQEAGDTSAELVQAADVAMFSAKANGRPGFKFYEPQMHEEIKVRRELSQALGRAVENSEFEVYYQPQVTLDTNNVTAYEALVRWNHPERGVISPDQFIPIAEEIGLICQIGEWVLHEACKQAVTWHNSECIAVNLSAMQFKDGDILNTVRSALEQSGLDPARLELEITESVLFHDPEYVLGTLSALKSLGVKLAMDDFGTGYSSLAHLWRFPFDKIKIDRSFVKNVSEDPKVAKIITSIIDLGRALDITIIAEGVECAQQEQFLRDRNCDLVQGYLYGHPAPSVLPQTAAPAQQVTHDTNAISQVLEVLKKLDTADSLTPEAGVRILQELVKVANFNGQTQDPGKSDASPERKAVRERG